MNHRFDEHVAQPAIQPGTSITTAVPAREANIRSDVIVPLLQALLTGAFVASLFMLVLTELVPAFDGDLLKTWGAAALLVTAVAWLILLGQHRKLLWALEKVTQLDLDGDHQVGQPQERVVIVNAGQGKEEAARQENAQRASEFARFVAALAIKGTSQRVWEPEIGRETWAEYRDALLQLGWARWKSLKSDGTPNETKGWALTLPAEEILARISG